MAKLERLPIELWLAISLGTADIFMAQVVLLSATRDGDQADHDLAPLRALRESANRDTVGSHSVIDDPRAAEVIIFAEFHGAGFYFERIRAHPVVKRYREKCFLFCSNAFVIPFLPGVYASIEKRWVSSRTFSGFYLGTPTNEFMTFAPATGGLPYLYSFMGCVDNAAVRRDLAVLSHPRSLFEDTAPEFHRLLGDRMSPVEMRDYHRRYAEVLKASKFVLCPRGLGVSTIRLFETMQMGRVPVVLSDNWVAPPGPRWADFSIRVRERDYARIPALLEQREPDAVAMGQLARSEWARWFSEEVAFHRVVESCLAIKRRRRIPEALARLPVYLQYLRPFHLRHLIRTKYQAARQTKA